MKRKYYLWFLVLLLMAPDAASGQRIKIGEEVQLSFESPHPYTTNLVQEIEYTEKEASYIVVHFSKFELAEKDKLIISSPDGSRKWTHTSDDNSRGEFWSVPIYGNKLIISLVRGEDSRGAFGFIIDKIVRGYTKEEINKSQNGKSGAAVCGNDDRLEAKCYQTSEPGAYERSRTVARLIVSGMYLSTGFLLGDEGHLMTCGHSIQNANEANNTVVEMMAEGSTCSTNCAFAYACSGNVVANSVTYVEGIGGPFGNTVPISQSDYVLVKLPTNVSGTYGYAQFYPHLPNVGDRIFIPQHLGGYGKQIAINSDNQNDIGGLASVFQVQQHSNGNTSLIYHADTEVGSSGYPVFLYNELAVAGIHCGGQCPNDGDAAISILNKLNYVPSNAVTGPAIGCGNGFDRYINQDEIITTNQFYGADLIIEPGITLTVNATLEFGQDKGIIVKRGAKLILDGGILTKCSNASFWKGVEVWGNAAMSHSSIVGSNDPETYSVSSYENANSGNNGPGMVILKNNSKIEYADRDAITTTRKSSPYDADYWGGIVYAENSEFYNNVRGVQFMKYDFSNYSQFRNVQFHSDTNDEFNGVSIWDCDQIHFIGCTFQSTTTHPSRYGIEVNDGSFEVRNNCTFSGLREGIKIQNSSPLSAPPSTIGDPAGTSSRNAFFNNQQGIYSNAPNLLEVVNNDFTSTIGYGIYSDGPGSINAEGNFISSPTGMEYINSNLTGITNDILCNEFVGSYGLNTWGANRSINFDENQFETDVSDVFVLNIGSSAGVWSHQGS